MRIIKSSKNIKASDSYNLDDETYKYVTNVDGYWIYRAIVDGKGVWRAMPQDSDESQFEELSFPISYDQARGFEPIDEPSAITKLRKDLGKKLLPKAGQSIESTDDLSMYSDEFRHAYTLAKNDFKKDYKRAHADVQIYPSDPYLGVEEGEIVLHVTGFNPYGKKCGGMVSVDESLDSDILYQAMKETAEDLGIRKGSYDIKNSTGSTIKANKSSSVRLQMKEELMDQILPEIKSKLKEIMTSPKFGFSYTEWRDYSGADIYLNNDGYFVVTVYAEVSYDGLVDIMDALNPIVEKYDSDAYFDADTPGRCSAYIDPDNIPSNMYPYDDIQNSEKIYSSQSQYTSGVYSATDDGEGYWFFTTHGVQPGSVPRDVDILDIIDTPNGSFVKFDRFLSTKELNYYDMVEKAPKSVMSAEVEDYINRNFDGVTSATEEDYDEEELQDIIDELTADGFDVTDEADLLMGLGADLGMDHADARYYAKLILNHMDDSSVLGASNEVELDPEESMIDVNIDQYIIVDSEGSWEYDSDNYDWASSDGEGSDWYSDNGVRLDDPTGVVEKIDELIEPHVPIEPGTYRVQGYVELYYTVSGVYENRYDYTEDDYSSDINSDFGSAEYNKKLSKIENVKVTKI